MKAKLLINRLAAMSSKNTPRGQSRGKEVADKNRPGTEAGYSRVAKKPAKPSDRLNPKTVDPVSSDVQDDWYRVDCRNSKVTLL